MVIICNIDTLKEKEFAYYFFFYMLHGKCLCKYFPTIDHCHVVYLFLYLEIHFVMYCSMIVTIYVYNNLSDDVYSTNIIFPLREKMLAII